MWKPKWLLAIPLAFATILGGGTTYASVRDEAGMFTKAAISKANSEIAKIERELKLGVTIETIESLDGDDVRETSIRLAEKSGVSGVFVLLVKKEKAISVDISSSYRRTLDSREPAIKRAFLNEFKKKDFDGGLLNGVETIHSEATEARAEMGTLRQQRRCRGTRSRNASARTWRLRTRCLLMIGLGLFAIMFVIRTIASLFGGGQHYGAPGRMGGPGYGGYGGGGGGFMSGLFGGIGGALAGNWLYDQFSGRHHGGYGDTSGYDAGNTDAGGDTWGTDTGSTGAWGDSGGDTGGGDWGGGGGGDWGGGGGGGDW